VEERRGALRRAALEAALTGARLHRRLALSLLASGLVLAPAAAVERCEPPPGFVPRDRLVSHDVVILYRTVPETVEVGRNFVVEAVVCGGEPAHGLRVDAEMPEHRHGMNYRPRVSPAGDGRYVAEGLLFHMPGRWQLRFDVERKAGTARLATDLVLE